MARRMWRSGAAGVAGKIAGAALLVAGCGLLVIARGGDLTLSQPKPRVRITEVPIKVYKYLVVADGRIGNLEHQNLLIDTGTSPSMIDKSVAAKLGLQGIFQRTLLFNKNIRSEIVTLPEIQVGPVARQNLPVTVADFRGISKAVGNRIDAVIGLDVLGGTNFTIDYAKHRLSFGDSVEAHSVPFTATQRFITVNLECGAKRLHLLLDTGAPQMVLFKNRLHDVDYLWSPVTGSGQNVSGAFSFETILLEQAKLGGKEVGPQRVALASQHDMENFFDGLMGISFLRPKRISFDFDRQVLGWSD